MHGDLSQDGSGIFFKQISVGQLKSCIFEDKRGYLSHTLRKSNWVSEQLNVNTEARKAPGGSKEEPF